MVRLESYGGTAGILQWYGWNPTVVRLESYDGTAGILQWYGWNPTVVRLESFSGTAGILQWYGWNPTMVRLESYDGTAGILRWYGWNPSVVRLESYSGTAGILQYSIRTKNCARNRNCATFQLTVPRSPVLILNFAGHKYLPLHDLYEFKRKIGQFFNIRNRLYIIGKSNFYYFSIFRFFGYKIQRNVFTEMLLSNKS